MNLLCELFRHKPVPFVSWRRKGRWENNCVICRQPIVYEGGAWRRREEAAWPEK